MDVIGIDLAASAKGTGVVRLRETGGSWTALEIETSNDDDLIATVTRATIVGIDAPLGWPEPFVAAIAAHAGGQPWPGGVDRSPLTHRETDRVVHELVGRRPLSASADKLGSVAMRCALLQQRLADEVWGRTASRDGAGRLIECYPAAAFDAWGMIVKGYKTRARRVNPQEIRTRVVGELRNKTKPWLDLSEVTDRCIASDHVLDALVCAITVLCVREGHTLRPTPDQQHLAEREGWIHVPTSPLEALSPS